MKEIKSIKKTTLAAVLLLSLLTLLVSCIGGGESDDGYRTVTVLSDNEELGTVLGGGRYYERSKAGATAVPNEGCRFVGWSNGQSGSSIEFTVIGDMTLIAYFEPIPKTLITSIDLPTSYKWGEAGVSELTGVTNIRWNNGTSETVDISELQISGFSTESVGQNHASVGYLGYTYTYYYDVLYTELDTSGINFRKYYLQNEEIDISGEVIGKGLDGRSEAIPVNDSRVELSGFATNRISYQKYDKEIPTESITLRVSGWRGGDITLEYAVWYCRVDEATGIPVQKSASAGPDAKWGYTYELSDFSICPDDRFTMSLYIYKDEKQLETVVSEVWQNRDCNWKMSSEGFIELFFGYKKIGVYYYKTGELKIFASAINEPLPYNYVDDHAEFLIEVE